MKAMVLVWWFVVAILSGCATAPNTIRLSDGQGEKVQVVREMAIDPVMFSGLPWTDDLQSGRFVTVMGTFPQTPESYAEWDPLRIRYQAHAIGADGKEYVAHAVFAGYIACVPRFFVFVEGLQEPLADVKAITLSTLLSRAYDLHGHEVAFDAAKFQSDAAYRREVIGRDGTPLAAVRPVRGMRQAFDGWSVYDTKAGRIVTPLDTEKVKYLAGINPQYSYWEKVTGTTRAAVSPDYISTAIGAVFDLISAGQAKSHGFDSGSVQSRSRQGYNIAALQALRDAGQKSCVVSERSKP